ncbi:hypothetical protein ACM55F_10100 [Flavobacterium sp. XS2P12]|uniref:hypothetical protein n=1 Tax=Flavobacterium melibiosi TaxID=3398734 RepID=UPI003A89D366
MYLQLLNYASYFLSFLFIAFLCWSLNWTMLKNMWLNAKAGVLIKKKTTEALANGMRKFEFEGGNVVIYAKTQAKAVYDYKQLKKEASTVRRQLKKA